jgi:ankyrin repeat protein
MAFLLSGEMLLWEAVSNKDLPEVKRLLAKGADPNMLCPDAFVRLQASEKMRPGQSRDTGRSLLHHAAWAGDLAVFRAVVEAGGDIDKKRNTILRPNGGVNGRGSKPLHFATMYRRLPIVKYLLELGADVNAAGEQGYTPLHISVKFNFPELMELLLLAGARTDMITKEEKTARDLARWGGENTTEAMGDILQLFDRYEAECRARGAAAGQRYEPGAPLLPLAGFGGSTGASGAAVEARGPGGTAGISGSAGGRTPRGAGCAGPGWSPSPGEGDYSPSWERPAGEEAPAVLGEPPRWRQGLFAEPAAAPTRQQQQQQQQQQHQQQQHQQHQQEHHQQHQQQQQRHQAPQQQWPGVAVEGPQRGGVELRQRPHAALGGDAPRHGRGHAIDSSPAGPPGAHGSPPPAARRAGPLGDGSSGAEWGTSSSSYGSARQPPVEAEAPAVAARRWYPS